MKDNKTQDNNQVNPFDFANAAEQPTNQSRRIDYTPQLIALSNQRATELMHSVKDRPELFELANKVITDCDVNELITLIGSVYDDDAIQADSQILVGATDDVLSRLLESRRSDRSKAKAKNPKSNVNVCITYFSAMYAELLIRSYWKKPYSSTGSADVSDASYTEDREALERKIKSLQSKKCRLTKTAPYVQADKLALQEVDSEIERLSNFRPNTPVSAKTVLKGLDLDQIRNILKDVDLSTLSPEKKAEYDAILAKIG